MLLAVENKVGFMEKITFEVECGGMIYRDGEPIHCKILEIMFTAV